MGVTIPLGENVGYTFAQPTQVTQVHIVFDSDLDRGTLPGDWCEKRHSMRANIVPESPTMTMPKTLAKSYTVTGITDSGEEITLFTDDCNIRHCMNIPVNRALTSLSLRIDSLWDDGAENVHIFSFDAR